MTHPGLVDSERWLKCQRKMENNRQITRSYSNPTSWLAGKVCCEKCECSMTTVKGRTNKNGETRRYFNCTGRSHKKICTGQAATIYAEDLENMIYDCISAKLAVLEAMNSTIRKEDAAEINHLKLKIKAIEKAENQLLDTILAGGFNDALLAVANQKALQLKQGRLALYEQIKKLKSPENETETAVNLIQSWRNSDYTCRKSTAMLLIHQIGIRKDGSIKIRWIL